MTFLREPGSTAELELEAVDHWAEGETSLCFWSCTPTQVVSLILDHYTESELVFIKQLQKLLLKDRVVSK